MRPSAIRAFLIADIRGYTRFTDQFGDEAASRLASTFAQIVSEAMEAWGGQLVELRGDEALCAFASPRASVRCALELQLTFAEEATRTPSLPLAVGMGLDVGEAVPVGDGYRGAALNLAARLCAGAAAGEVRATQDLAHVAGSIPGVEYEQLGTERLKGVAADVAVVRVRATSETAPATHPVEEPAQRPTEPLPSELASVVPFVGRRGDLIWLRWYWRRARLGHGRVVEIVGPSGIGKTRLVSELARIAQTEGATVHSTLTVPAETADTRKRHPTLVVIDDADRAPSRLPDSIDQLEAQISGLPLLVVVTQSKAVDASGPERPRRMLEPLTEEDVATVAALYTSDSLDSPPIRQILEQSGGSPRAVHRMASQWARVKLAEQMGDSARRTSRERRRLRSAEDELMGRYADFELTRERTRMYASGDGDETSEAPAPTMTHDVCPYKGLAAYEAADAAYYFGRERLIGELIARVVGSSFVGLVGASGSGKSSALSAGLLPALARGALPDSDQWIQVVMRPGNQPMSRLADALGRVVRAGEDPDVDAAGLLDRVISGLAASQRLIVVIDQFEEVFTAGEEEQDRFIGLIAEARPGMKVVVAVRADQYERCASYPRLARQLAADQVLVGPLRGEEIARITRHPAERVGLRVESGLVEALVEDLGAEPGAMPLLSTALLELWEARDERRLTLAAYRATGGVRLAVARLAESAFTRLDESEQESARSLFMRLVGEGSDPETIVRRRLSRAELDSIGDPRIAAVIEKLTTGRLLTRDDGTVEVAHEALIREWPRLRDWIEADAEGRQVRLRLIESAQAWDAAGRGEEDLYRGARLAAALEWAQDHEFEINAMERDFLAASRTSAEEAAGRQRRTNRILRGLLAGAGVLLVVAIGAGVVAWVQAGRNAENASIAEVREVSLTALNLVRGDHELALLLAAEAVRVSRDAGRPPPPEALQALWSAYVAGKSITTVPGLGTRALAYSPDGAELAVGAPEQDGELVTIRDPSTGEEVEAIPRPAEAVGIVESIAYSPDGQWLAVSTSGPEGTSSGSVMVFGHGDPEPIQRLSAGHDGYRTVTLNEVGLISAVGFTEGRSPVEVMVWELATGEERARIVNAPGNEGTELAFPTTTAGALRSDSAQLVLGWVTGLDFPEKGLVGINLPATPIRCPSCPDTHPSFSRIIDLFPDVVVPSPRDDRIAVADTLRGRLVVIDLLLGMPVFEPVEYDAPHLISWNADGTLLAVSGGESGVAVIDAATGLVQAMLPSGGIVTGAAAFRPGSDEIATVTARGELRIYHTRPTDGDIRTAGRRPMDIGITADHAIVSFADVGVAVYDRGSSAEVHSRDFLVNSNLHGQVARDAALIAGTHQIGASSLLEVATLRETARLPGCVAVTGTSADGAYLVFEGGQGIGGLSCEGVDQPGGVFDVARSTLLIEYAENERIRFGAVSVPEESGGRRYAAVSVYAGASGPGRLDIWDMDTATLLATLDAGTRPGFQPASVSFSPDARLLAVGTNGPGALVIDIPTLTDGSTIDAAIVFEREVHSSRTLKVVVTGDGILGTSGSDGEYRIWRVGTGELIMSLEVTGLLGNGSFDFSPDFEFLYYEDGGGVIRRMPVDIDAMTDLATTSLTRSLTDDECRQYLHTDGCVDG
jgi:class 3 adenylate cyclase/WD40 repeat protein/energy-coupling factor transporter ATP-binding protein EcfA2